MEHSKGCKLQETGRYTENCAGCLEEARAFSNREMQQWWTLQSEQYRKSVVGHIRGSLAYGLTVSWNLLPRAAKQAIVTAFRQGGEL